MSGSSTAGKEVKLCWARRSFWRVVPGFRRGFAEDVESVCGMLRRMFWKFWWVYWQDKQVLEQVWRVLSFQDGNWELSGDELGASLSLQLPVGA